MDSRYFVTIHAVDARALRELTDFDVDIFQATARAGDSVPRIEGLITLADVGRLVAAGYRVTVEATEQARARADQVASLDEWLPAMGEA